MSKKLRLGFIAIILILVLSLSLIACVKPGDEDDDDEDDFYMSAVEVLDKVLAGHGVGESGVLNVNLGIDVKVGEETHKLAFGANMVDGDTELAISLKNTAGNTVFGLYVLKGKIYIDAGAGQPKLYLADFDVTDLLKAALELDLEAEADKIISGLLDGMAFNDIYQLLAGMIFSDPHHEAKDGQDIYTMNVKVTEIFDLIKSLLSSQIDLNELMFNAGLNVDIDLSKMIADLLVPNFMVKFTATMSGDKTLNTNFLISNYDAALYDINITSSVNAAKGDIGIPSDIADYLEFSLTNLSFDAVINVKSDKLDLADIVNLITASNTLPKGVVVLDANRDFAVKFRMDLDVYDNNANQILLEIYDGKTFDKLLVGAYFTSGELLIKFENALPSTIKIPNLKIKGVNISQELQKIVELISGAIAMNVNESDVVSVNAKQSTAVLSPDILAFADSVVSLLGVNDYVKITDNKVSVKINSDFLAMLNNAIPSLNIGNIPDFGDITLGFNLDKTLGIRDIDIFADIPDYNVELVANINNINFGYVYNNIGKEIAEAIKGITFTANLENLLYDTLSGVNIEGKLNIDLPAGTYNLATLLGGFGATLPDMNYTLTEAISFVADLKLSMNLNKAEPKKSKLLFEIRSNTDTVLAPKGLFMGMYYVDGAMYLDLSNIKMSGITMPLLKIDIDLMSMLVNEIDKLSLGELLTLSQEPTSALTPTNDTSNPYLSAINDIIEINVDKNKLAVVATSQAIVNLLNNFNMGIMLPPFTLTGDIYNIDDIRINLDGGELQMNLNIDTVEAGVEQDINIDINVKDSQDNIMDMLLNKFGSVNISTRIELNTGEGEMDLTNLINGILSSTGNTLTVPVKMDLVNYLTYLHVNLAWNIDMTDAKKTELMLELRADNAAGQVIFGLYLFNGTTYLDVNAIGAKFNVSNLGLAERLIQELNTLKNSQDWNIGNIINGLLKPNTGGDIVTPPSEPGETPSIPNVAIPEEFWLEFFKGIKIENTMVGLTLTNSIMKSMLATIGIDLGMDANLSGSIDTVGGILELEGAIGKLKLKITSVVKEIGQYNKLPLTVAQFKDFNLLDATTGYSMADTLLKQMSPEFYIDLYSNNTDKYGANASNHTRIWVEKKTNSGTIKPDSNKSGGAFTYAPGDIYIAITDGKDLQYTYLHVLLQVDKGNIHIVATRHVFELDVLGIKADGTDLAFDIPMDIKGMLGGMFDELLKVLKPTSAAPVNAGGAQAVADAAPIDIASLIKDIRFGILPTDQLRLSVNFQANPFNTFLTEFVGGFLKGLDLSAMPGMGMMDFSKVDYNQTGGEAFYNSLWTHVIYPYVKSQASGVPDFALEPIVGGIKNKIHAFVKRFLPLPLVTEGAVHINMYQGKLSAIDVDFYNANSKEYFNMDIVNLDGMGGIDWSIDVEGNLPSQDHNNDQYSSGKFLVYNKTQRTDILFDPLNGQPLNSYFNKKARMITTNDDRNITAGRFVYQDIVWTFPDGFDTTEPAPGSYTVVGTAFDTSITVKLRVMTGGEIESLQGITASVYGALPTEVVAIMKDGTRRTLNNVTIIAPPTGYAGHTVSGTAKINGIVHAIEVEYLDTTITELFYGDIFTISAYSALNGSWSLPSWINVKFGYGAHGSLPVRFDTSSITGVDFNGGEYDIVMIVGSGAIEQRRNIKLKITPRIVEEVKFDNASTTDEVVINPYEYANLADDKKQDIFPKTTTVYYENGDSEILTIVWKDTTLVKYGYMGGRYRATIEYTAGTLSWTREIDVNVVKRKLFYLTFGGDRHDKVIQIDPLTYTESGASHYFTETVNAVFEHGEDMNLPVVWDTTGLIVTIEGGYYHVKATIGTGATAQTISVPVRVKPSVPQGISLPNGKYTISSNDVLYGGKEPFSATINVILEGGVIEARKVTWKDKSGVVINGTAGNCEAIITVSGVDFYIQVEVLPINDIVMDINEMFINPMTYKSTDFFKDTMKFMDGNILKDFKVKWNMAGMTVNKDGGTFVVTATTGSGDVARTFDVTVNVAPKIVKSINNGTNAHKMDTTKNTLPANIDVTLKDGTVVNTPVVWGYSGIDLTKPGVHTIKANFFNANANMKQQLDITLTIEAKEIILANNGSNNIEIVAGGTLPENLLVTYKDATNDTLPVAWDLLGADLTVLGKHAVEAKFFAAYPGNQQTITVTVMVKDKTIATVFGDKNTHEITMGEELPSQLDITYEGGTTATLDVVWDMRGSGLTQYGSRTISAIFYADIDGATQYVSVELLIKAKEIATINGDSNDMSIMKGDTLPATITVKYTDGTSEILGAVWSAVDTTKPGIYALTAMFFEGITGVEQTVSVSVTVKDNTIISAGAVAITTGAALPSKVTVTYEGGATAELDVTWAEGVDKTAPGVRSIVATFYNGVTGVQQQVDVSLTVNAKKVATVNGDTNVIDMTTAGTLPTTLTVKFEDGTTAELAVVWVITEGDSLTVAGTYTVKAKFYDGIVGSEQLVDVTVNVTEPPVEPPVDPESPVEPPVEA